MFGGVSMKIISIVWLLCVCLVAGLSCQTAPLEITDELINPIFVNVTIPVGLPETFLDMEGRPGISWGDYNNDGHEDLLIFHGKKKECYLFENDGSGKFRDVTQKAGLVLPWKSTAGYWADYDNDGDEDIFIVPDMLWRNDKGIFINVSKKSGLKEIHNDYHSESAAWGDADRDGFVDLVVPCVYPRKDAWTPAPVYFYQNNGNGTFIESTKAVGLPDPDKPERVNRTAAWCDYDNDGDFDLYLASYRLYADYLFRNNGQGKFTNVAVRAGFPQQAGQNIVNGHSLGISWVDYDRDGFFDLYFCPQHDGNRLYRNAGPPNWYFKNVAAQANLVVGINQFRGRGNEHLSCGWGDYDNDGYPDVYITREKEGGFTNLLLRNRGDGTFEIARDFCLSVGINDFGHAVTWCDYDHDGRLDLIIGSEGSKPPSHQNPDQFFVKIYHNVLDNGNNWVQLKLEGKKSNRSAINARVILTAGGLTQIQEVDGGSGSISQNPRVLHFGLGKAKKIKHCRIIWPSGKKQTVMLPTLNKRYIITEED